jgi:hypothetical protein
MDRKDIVAATIVAAVLASGVIAAAQQSVSTGDIQRLQDQVFQASSELSRLRSTDSALASELETQLDELREEVVYLKVKLRKDGVVNRTEYADLRDRLQDLRSRARGESRGTRPYGGVPGGVSGGTSGGVSGGTSGGVSGDRRTSETTSAIPVGQEIDVRLQTELSSSISQVEERFEATTVADLGSGNRVLIPAGSVVRGVVRSVDKASRTDRRGSLTLAFDQITVDGRAYPIRGLVVDPIESEGVKSEAGRIGAGAGVGAIIGGIIGGVKGALLGVLIGGGGTIAATPGKDVTLPAGTVLRVRLDTPPDLR